MYSRLQLKPNMYMTSTYDIRHMHVCCQTYTFDMYVWRPRHTYTYVNIRIRMSTYVYVCCTYVVYICRTYVYVWWHTV